MVTTEEVGRVALFAALDEAEREQLSRVAADISLESGEYAAPQGSQAALFAVLDGRIEPVQRSDGVERVVGVRHPGEIFGEVPITLGTVFPVGFRAAVSSRVLRIEPHDYHATARAAGPGRGSASTARDRHWASLGPCLHRAEALPRSQPGDLRVAVS